MDITLLAPLAGAAVAALVALIWFLGGRDTACFENPDQALDRLRQDFYDYIASDIAISTDNGQTALLAPAADCDLPPAAVFAVGSDFATRLLRAGDITKLNRDGLTLSFKLNEFTGKALAISFGDEDGLTRWQERLAELEA